MIYLSDFRTFFAQHGAWIAAICSAMVVILASVESTSHFTRSLFGMHYQVESSSGSKDMIYHIDFSQKLMPSDEMPVLYKIGVKDILTILALHLPIHIIFFFAWDNMMYGQPIPGATRESNDRCCFYLTSELMLFSCLVLDCIIASKERYLDAFPLEWNGPTGHMTFLVKLCFLVQMAVLCYYLELLYFSGLSITLMRDCWIIGIWSLTFSVICYVLNFVPLMVTVGIQHFGQQSGEANQKALSIMGKMPDELEDFTRFVFLSLRCIAGLKALIYLDVMKHCFMCRGNSSIFEQVFLLVPLSALVVLGVLSFRGNRSFDQLQTRDGVQAS